MRLSGLGVPISLVAVLLAASMTGAAADEPQAGAPPETISTTDSAPGTTVTLVTGDQVRLDAEHKVVGVRPARGREGMPYTVHHRSNGTVVVPADARSMLLNGALDERLFQVDYLADHGYDDAEREGLPLIVIGGDNSGVATTMRQGTGATVGTELDSVNGVAVVVGGADLVTFWESITTAEQDVNGSRVLAGTVKKVWLDGRVKATLDHSVPQIGAPTAWGQGLDGNGVTIAVLDTGIDDDHPDLQNQVVAARNFTDSDDTHDRFGHGTHVAATIAGTGAASNGRYTGVAPAAQLLNGKVLDDDGSGCESSVIAGMEWAVDQGAHVVNMSLGGHDTPGLDPVEEAVERLTKENGTLFVAAAGNNGPGKGSVDSPASAPSALAVGAVGQGDIVAPFSSRGPAADGALKPEVTAPGVDITAAHAGGDPAYTTSSGTSMATPHVAGAAAILAQQNPDWNAPQIKAALTASAQATTNLTAFAEGAGRVDIAATIDQVVTTSPSALDFGLREYPHDTEPATQELTYHNAGDEPVELTLSVEAFGPEDATWDPYGDGSYDYADPAPGGRFTVEPASLVVPAGGQASVDVP